MANRTATRSAKRTAKRLARRMTLILAAAALTLAFASPLAARGPEKGADASVWDGSVDITWFTGQPLDTTDYYIDTPAQLAGLAYIVNGRLDAEKFPVRYKAGAGGTADADVDVPATVAGVVDGADESKPEGEKTVSGCTAESLWNNEVTHVNTSGGGSGVMDYDLYIGNQAYDFAGKTIHITSDLDLGGYDRNGEPAGPNWMPIGGRFPADMKTKTIIVDANFNGAIEGGFHTIQNIYCDRLSPGNYMHSQGVGLIGSLGDLYDDPLYLYGHSTDKESLVKEDILKGWTASVRNLCMGDGSDEATYRGYITANRMVGGIVGRAKDAVIENCANYTYLKNTDHKGIGGILGTSDGKGAIRNCYNSGNIMTTSDGCPAGGIVGTGSFGIYNCYNVGSVQAPYAKTLSEGIGSHYGGEYVVDNCYSLNGSFTDTGREGLTTKNGYYYGEAKGLVINTFVRNARSSGAEGEDNGLKDPGFLAEINAGAGNIFVAAPEGVNDGYPILFWQGRGFDPNGSGQITIGAGSGKGSVEAARPAGGYQTKTVMKKGDQDQVPVGTVLVMSPDAAAPNVLERYTAASGGNRAGLRADLYTVTGDEAVTLDGDFVTLTAGTVQIPESGLGEIGVSKTGTVLDDNGKAWSVRDYTVTAGDTLFQNDVLTAKAILNDGSVCKDKDKEFTGKFTYCFAYSLGEQPNEKTNATGIHKVSRDVGEEGTLGSLEITATPQTREKTWETLADTEWAGDVSDIRGTYRISTARQLAGLALLVNRGESFAKATVILEKSVSLKNPDEDGSVRKWEPIGRTSGTAFRGAFDGGGHTISGMTVDASAGGLFCYTRDAEVRDLTLTGKVDATGSAAGIIAVMSGGSVRNCLSKVTVRTGGSRAGGIAAQMTDKAEADNCVNQGSVTAAANAGGIAGEARDTAGVISRCANFGDVRATGGTGNQACTGGLVGYLGTKIDRSANFGRVESRNACVGGIAGFAYANTKASTSTVRFSSSSAIENSFNRGAVKGTATAEQTFVGGLAGRSDYLVMKNSYTTGAVSSNAVKKTFLSSVVGGFYQSIYSDVSLTYYSGAESPTTSYTKRGSVITAGTVNPNLTNFKTERKTAAQMRAPEFTALLNRTAPGTFVAAAGDAPQLSWIAARQDYTVTFRGAYNGTEKTCVGGEVDLPECPDEGYKYVFKKPDGSPFDGTDVRSDLTITVSREKVKQSSLMFTAGGRPVDLNGDGQADARDRLHYWCEDGSGTPYTFLSEENIIKDPLVGIGAIPGDDAIPAREGYTAAWDLKDGDGVAYTDPARQTPLGTRTLTAPAVYRQHSLAFAKSDDGNGTIRFAAEITGADDGYYFLKPQAKGTITVKNGAQVTLDGSNGPFNNLRIVVESGARLTLKDMELETDPVKTSGAEENAAALDIRGGSSAASATVLRFAGYSSITGTNDGSNGKDNHNVFPAVAITGYVKLDQAGSAGDTLHIVAGKDNPNIDIPTGATMEVAGGIVQVYRKERLGKNGGMIYGSSFDYTTRALTGDQKGNLTVSGGTLIAVSDTNNVFAACVNRYTQTGGHAIFYAPEASMNRPGEEGYIGTDVALYAGSTDISGGSLSAKVRTHRNKASDPIRYYSNGDAIACGEAGGFSGKYFLYAVDTSDWDRENHEIRVDGSPYYQGKGNTASHPLETSDSVRDKFSVKRSAADPLIYLWLPCGSAHRVELDGKVMDEAVDETGMEHVRYLSAREGNTFTLTFLDRTFAAEDTGKTENGKPVKAGTVAALAFYSGQKDLTGFLSKETFLLTDSEQKVSFTSDQMGKADHMKLFLYDGAKSLRPLAPSRTFPLK